MTENGWGQYDEFIDELERDTRVGDHDFMVKEVNKVVLEQVGEKWIRREPVNGEDFQYEVMGELLTSSNAMARLKWKQPPPKDVVKREIGTWDTRRKRGTLKAIQIAKIMSESYGKTVADLRVGDVLRVKTTKTKDNPRTGRGGGFIEVQVVLPKEQIGQASKEQAASASEVPF